MVEEARLERTESGLSPVTDGWFVLNLGDASRVVSEDFGSGARVEGDDEAEFKEIGVNVDVLQPGEPACLYHRESVQEDFLVLSGECLLVIEGQERRLRAWDFVHCPPGTDHVFVGAGDGPCSLLLIGIRREDATITYPVNEVAARHNASVEEETDSPREAYAKYAPVKLGIPDGWDSVPWAR